MADKRRLNSIASRYDLDVSRHRDPWRELRVRLSYIFAIGSIAACVPWLVGDHRAFESRCISNAHRKLEQKCSNCHDQSFMPVWRALTLDNSIHSTSDQQCRKCHQQTNTDHLLSLKDDKAPQWKDRAAILEKQVAQFSKRHCAQCHDEHRGNSTLTDVADIHCTGCHTTAHGQIAAPRFQLNFSKFVDHPEFSIWKKLDSSDELRQPKHVEWEDSGPVDQSKIRFSHHRHLDPELPTADRKTTRLECSDCHQSDLGGGYFRPINFEQHCHRCHKLGFPSTGELPHSQPEIIHGILLDRLKNEIGKKKPAPVAVDEIGGPTKRPINAPAAGGDDQPDFAALVGEPLKKLEQQLFSPAQPEGAEKLPRLAGLLEAACTKCHFSERSGNNHDDWKLSHSNLPEQWLGHSRFRHDRHFSIDCTVCHTRRGDTFDRIERKAFYPVIVKNLKDSASIYASVSARDVLMPRIEVCHQCHNHNSGPAGRPLVSDNCVDCHAYHHTPPENPRHAGIVDMLKENQTDKRRELRNEPAEKATP